MFAKRLISLTAQTAKRSLSIAHYAKPMVMAVKCTPFMNMSVRKMSDTTNTASLAEVLSTELQEEIQNDEISQEFLDIKNQIAKSFTIHEEEGSGVVKLTSTTAKESIEVVFDVQDEVNEDEFEEDFEEGEEDVEDDEEEGGGIGIKFHVTVQKKHTEDKVVFYCVAGQQLMIENAQYLPAGKSISDTDIYHGPIFNKLSDDLQESMLCYLADRGIDEDMAFFIMSYSENKEQREYMNWLKKLMIFVEAK